MRPGAHAEVTGGGHRSVVAIVVNYNAGKWLGACVDALRRSLCSTDVCVVDNASTDGSLAGLTMALNEAGAAPGAAAGEVRIIRNMENVGFARANNQILAERRADYYVLVNPDCIVETDTIGALIDVMQDDRDVGLASCVIKNADGGVQRTCRRRFPTPGSALARTLGLSALFPQRFEDFDLGAYDGPGVEYVDAVSGAFMVVRGSALERVGNLDEGYFMHCEDLDWCKRFWQSGFKVAFVPGVFVTHAKGASGRSLRVNWHLHRGMLRFYRKFYLNQYPKPLLPLVYLGVFASFLMKSAGILLRGGQAGARHG